MHQIRFRLKFRLQRASELRRFSSWILSVLLLMGKRERLKQTGKKWRLISRQKEGKEGKGTKEKKEKREAKRKPQFAIPLGQVREILSSETFAASLWLDLAWRFSDLEMTWLLYCSGAATVKQWPANSVSLCSRTIYRSVDRRRTSTGTAHILTAGHACPLLHGEI